MCLAIPAKITKVGDDNIAVVDILGATRDVSLDLTPQAGVGDYVLVHAGFAIEVVDEQFAQETIDLIKEFPELADEEMNGAHNLKDAHGQDGQPGQGENPMGSMQSMLASLSDEM